MADETLLDALVMTVADDDAPADEYELPPFNEPGRILFSMRFDGEGGREVEIIHASPV